MLIGHHFFFSFKIFHDLKEITQIIYLYFADFTILLTPNFTLTALRYGRNERYHYDASKCQPTCRIPKTNCIGKEDGCECDKGYIFSEKRCVLGSHWGGYCKDIYLQVGCYCFIFFEKKRKKKRSHIGNDFISFLAYTLTS